MNKNGQKARINYSYPRLNNLLTRPVPEKV
jgi:hypothetical protein